MYWGGAKDEEIAVEGVPFHLSWLMLAINARGRLDSILEALLIRQLHSFLLKEVRAIIYIPTSYQICSTCLF